MNFVKWYMSLLITCLNTKQLMSMHASMEMLQLEQITYLTHFHIHNAINFILWRWSSPSRDLCWDLISLLRMQLDTFFEEIFRSLSSLSILIVWESSGIYVSRNTSLSGCVDMLCTILLKILFDVCNINVAVMANM